MRKGTVTLRAYHQGGAFVIDVADDGRGLHRDKILAKAKERGMAVSDNMSDAEVWQLIFEAGFSTADKVTDVSGRGVGMDVVRRNITEMGGRVEIQSTADVGTRISIKLPLTLAILDGMSVRVGKEVFILPLTSVSESLQPAAGAVHTISGRGCVIAVRGPLFMFAFIACLLLPAGCSLLSAAIGHPIYMIGGAPGGWRSTWQNHGLHRLTCDAASLLVIALALIAPMEPTTAAAVLIFFLPAIRVGSMITLWVLLARSHGFGPVRVIFLGLPSIFFVSVCSGCLAFILALYFYAYLVARSF